MGEALEIAREHLLLLGEQEAELSRAAAGAVMQHIGHVASTFTDVAKNLFPGQITPETLRSIQSRIDDNLRRLR